MFFFTWIFPWKNWYDKLLMNFAHDSLKFIGVLLQYCLTRIAYVLPNGFSSAICMGVFPIKNCCQNKNCFFPEDVLTCFNNLLELVLKTILIVFANYFKNIYINSICIIMHNQTNHSTNYERPCITDQERAINLSILTMSGPGKSLRVESNQTAGSTPGRTLNSCKFQPCDHTPSRT